ncbi:DUF421 domain-containing protein [Alkalihalobacterium chitinilyticum]|uniref:DUF421 domain-containing protein n=1 Tax=Alkalihalobacterium chitinilyticum TaxID=2980103 RepID=A0ABT5VBT2_9BACI|nr:YetF domain-containing protein [Alkalihalobacterium chitinilyticum]MDE5412802.1 DUF421 domain-containing protein [Alkalihalobacterium chitinilyticum]
MIYVPIFLKTLLMFSVGITAFRLMGSQAVGEMTDFDLVVVIAIGALMGAPLVDPSIHPLTSIIAISGFVVAQIVFSFLSLKSDRFEVLIMGRPIQIIRNGKVLMSGLKKARMTTKNLDQELRIKGIETAEKVKDGFLEPNGKVSLLLAKKSTEINIDKKETP